MDHLEEEYGIKKDVRYYSICFKLQEVRDVIQVKGELLNFTSQQIVLKSNDGLYIIHPQTVVELRPLFKLNNK